MNFKKKKLTAGDATFNVINYLVFGIFTLICIYPFYYMVINTISANDLSAAGAINFLPKGLHLENYRALLELKGLGTAALVSVGKTVIGTGLTVIATAFLGFMFSQEKMWKRKFWYRFIVITMYFNAGLIPMFITMKNLHLTNTFWVYIIPTIIQPFNIILVKTYVESLPKALQEAAEIDGAGIFKIFYKIILPLSKPIVVNVALGAFMAPWGDYITSSYIMGPAKAPNYDNWTVARTLYGMLNDGDYNSRPPYWRTFCAGAVCVAIPTTVIFMFMQKYYVSGVTGGSVKG